MITETKVYKLSPYCLEATKLFFCSFCYSASSGGRRVNHVNAAVDSLVSGLTKHNFSKLMIEIYTTVFPINLRKISSK